MGWNLLPVVVLCVFGIGCVGEKDNSFPFSRSEDTAQSSEQETGVEELEEALGQVEGDPIHTLRTLPTTPLNFETASPTADIWLDVATYDSTYAVQVGTNGLALVSREDGQILDRQNNGSATRVDSDGDLIVVGSRTGRVGLWRFEDPQQLSPAGFIESRGIHEQVAVDNDVIAVAWRTDGLSLYRNSTDLQTIGNIAGNDVYAVDIWEGWLVYSDATELVLLNILDPSNPVERFRLDIGVEARDISMNGSFIAIGCGGRGLKVFTFDPEMGLLAELDSMESLGSVFSVSVDESDVWVSNWRETRLFRIVEERLQSVAHESPQSASIAVSAMQGRALIADWYQSTLLEVLPTQYGAEVSIPERLRFRQGEPVPQEIWIENGGSIPLEIAFDRPPAGFSIEHVGDDQRSATIPVDGRTSFRVSVPSGMWNDTILTWQSNDPDELFGELAIQSSMSAEGSLHPDFALPLVSASGASGSARLSDFQGKWLVLIWWNDPSPVSALLLSDVEQSIAQFYENQPDVVVLLANAGDTMTTIQARLSEHQVSMLTVMDQSHSLYALYDHPTNFSEMPRVVVVDQTGVIRYFSGYLDSQNVREYITNLGE